MGTDRHKQRHPQHGPNDKPIALTGTAVWTVDEGKLERGWVAQASFELYHRLFAK